MAGNFGGGGGSGEGNKKEKTLTNNNYDHMEAMKKLPNKQMSF